MEDKLLTHRKMDLNTYFKRIYSLLKVAKDPTPTPEELCK